VILQPECCSTNSHYPCHKQRWNLQWIQSMLSGAFDLGTKRVTREPPCKLVNNRGAKQTMLSLRSIQMDVGDCITLRHPNTPHSKEITSKFQHHLWSRRLCLARLPSSSKIVPCKGNAWGCRHYQNNPEVVGITLFMITFRVLVLFSFLYR
jgi:hypothetical protein